MGRGRQLLAPRARIGGADQNRPRRPAQAVAAFAHAARLDPSGTLARRHSGPRWRVLATVLAVATARGQEPQPSDAARAEPTATAPAWELPDDVRAALACTSDFVFNFDQPGFYAVAAFVRGSPRSPGFAQPPLEVNDWRDLLDRPGEFRGRPVTIEGLVGRNKDPYTLRARPDLGTVSQLELYRQDQPVACTVILTTPAADIPVGATVQATGYFVMIRQYHGPSGRVQQAALLVAPGPTRMDFGTARRSAADAADWRWMAGAAVLGLLIAIVLVRRAGQTGRRRDRRELRARRDAPVNLADDLARWAERESPDDH